MFDTYTISMTADQVDAIVIDRLLSNLESLRAEVELLKSKESLKKYQIEDMTDHLFYIKAIENLLSYYMIREDYEEKVGRPMPRPV